MLSSQCTRVQAWFLLLCTLCRTQRGDYWEEGHRQQFLRRSVEIEISSRQGDSCSKERSNEAGFEFINIFSNVPPSLSHLKSLTLTLSFSAGNTRSCSCCHGDAHSFRRHVGAKFGRSFRPLAKDSETTIENCDNGPRSATRKKR